MKAYDILLTTVGPVHVGCGDTLAKNEYVYDRRDGMAHIVHKRKMVQWLYVHNLMDSYEDYFFKNEGKNNNLFNWLKNTQHLKDYKLFTDYSLAVGGNSNELNNLQLFVKGGDGKPYIPGSSLKGAIRTCLLAEKLRDSNPDIFKQYLKRRKGQDDLETEIEKLEKRVFTGNTKDFVDDQMRHLIISDSEPLEFDDFIVTKKIDRRMDGGENQISTFRESLRPGVEIRFRMTIQDDFGFSLSEIEDAISNFYFDNDYYFLQDFGVEERPGQHIYIGGGSGFVSKTLVYPMAGERDHGVKIVSEILEEQFKNKKSENKKFEISHRRLAMKNGVSPQVLKTTRYGRQKLEMGLCKIEFKEVSL